MQHLLYGLRGKAYVKEYKKLYKELQNDIKKEYFEIVENPGKFTPLNLGELCRKYQIPVKVMDEWLPDFTDFPSGTWERLQWRGLKARDIGVVWN